MQRTLLLVFFAASALACRRSDDTVRADPPKPSACPSIVASSAPAPAAIPLDLPKTDAALTTVLSVTLDAKGELYLDGKKVTRADLESGARAAHAKDPDLRVVISADARTPHGQVISVLDLLRSVGIVKIAFAVNKPSGASAP